MGLVVREAYERLQVETGLSGNVFLRSYATYGCLATHTWYKVFWEYLDRYNVRLEIGEGYNVPAVRERDQVFMEEALPQTPHSTLGLAFSESGSSPQGYLLAFPADSC